MVLFYHMRDTPFALVALDERGRPFWAEGATSFDAESWLTDKTFLTG